MPKIHWSPSQRLALPSTSPQPRKADETGKRRVLRGDLPHCLGGGQEGGILGAQVAGELTLAPRRVAPLHGCRCPVHGKGTLGRTEGGRGGGRRGVVAIDGCNGNPESLCDGDSTGGYLAREVIVVFHKLAEKALASPCYGGE